MCVHMREEVSLLAPSAHIQKAMGRVGMLVSLHGPPTRDSPIPKPSPQLHGLLLVFPQERSSPQMHNFSSGSCGIRLENIVVGDGHHFQKGAWPWARGQSGLSV